MPTGRTVASRRTQYTANCSQPLAVMSEFLRIKKRGDEIAEKQNRQHQRDRRDQIHRELPQLLAGLDVKKRQAEENRREHQHRQILHRCARNSRTEGWPAARSNLRSPSRKSRLVLQPQSNFGKLPNQAVSRILHSLRG